MYCIAVRTVHDSRMSGWPHSLMGNQIKEISQQVSRFFHLSFYLRRFIRFKMLSNESSVISIHCDSRVVILRPQRTVTSCFEKVGK